MKIFAVVLALVACSQKAEPAAQQQQPVTVVCSCAPPPAPSPPPPCTSDPTAAPTAEVSARPTPTGSPAASPIDNARAAALRNEPATVRRYLEEKVRNGKGTPEEVNLVKQACKAMNDRSCTEDIKRKYSPVVDPLDQR